MSRLHIQNIPVYLTEDRLRDHFSSQGDVTDVCIVKTKEGKSRKFGFVGYRTEEDAARAKKYFDKTFLDTCKLQIQKALPRESAEIQRPWSQHSKGSSRFDQNLKAKQSSVVVTKEEKTLEKTAESKKSSTDESNTEFREFLETVQPRSQSKFWANDDTSGYHMMDEKKSKNDESSDDEYDANMNIQEEGVDASSSSKSKPSSEMSDLEFLKSKMNSKNKTSEKSSAKTHVQTAEVEAEPEIDARRLFVRNLPFSADEDDLRQSFAPFGTIEEIHMPLDDTKRKKGFGFVTFATTTEASAARDALDEQIFQGRVLHIVPSQVKVESAGYFGNPDLGEHLTYKKKQELARQQNLKQSQGWNASYLRGDTTADALASKLGLAKGDILDKESKNLAVRLAIGETLLVQENKDFFEQEGIDLDALEGAKTSKKGSIARSATILLIKNLPFSSNKEELHQMFGKFGEIHRFLLTPSNSLALVEFFEPSEARQAYRALAYKKYQHVPLYLEWAPAKVFLNDDHSAAKAKSVTHSHATTKTTSGKTKEGAGEDESTSNVSEENKTLYVKNLNFSTTAESLQQAFETHRCSIRKVTIAQKKDPHHSKKMLSMGYGFVEFDTEKEAVKALTKLTHLRVDGHQLEFKLSQKKCTNDAKKDAHKAQKSTKTKIIVRNIAFEATSKDVRELFAAFGQLKVVRMPKKFNHQHRGFAFIEFLTAQEAHNAFTALSRSHLYGRHLVIEWAEDDNGLDMLRKKASQDVDQLHNPTGHKKQKMN